MRGILIAILGFGVAASTAVEAAPKTKVEKKVDKKIEKKRNPAQQTDGSQVILRYGDTKGPNFKDIQIHIEPNSRYVSFESYGNKRYVLDCPKNKGMAWDCFSPCEGGRIEVSFEGGFKTLVIKPFNIRPRLCDGSESDQDPELTARQTIKLELNQIEP